MRKSELEKSAIDLTQYAIGKNYPYCNIYRIPFSLKDNTQGGKTYGRIRWNIEIIRSKSSIFRKNKRVFIEKMYIWAENTRDQRVARKLFKLELFSKTLFGNILNKQSSVEPCSVHSEGAIISTYPEDKYSANNECILEINASTSVMVDINFMQNLTIKNV